MTKPGRSAVTVKITIAGKRLPDRYGLLSLNVETMVNKLGHAEIALLDEQQTTVEDTEEQGRNQRRFAPGESIRIDIYYSDGKIGAATKSTVFSGIISEYQFGQSQQGAFFTLTCKDSAVAMTRNRTSAVFERQKSDIEILRSIIKDYKSIAADINVIKSAPLSARMVQYFCNDWDFILMRAAANGWWVSSSFDKLRIFAPDVAKVPAHTFDCSDSEHLDLNYSVSMMDQFARVEAKSWDVRSQKTIKRSKIGPIKSPQGKLNPSATAVSADVPVRKIQTYVDISDREVAALADAAVAQAEHSFCKGVITVPGTTKHKIGDTIRFKDLDQFADGRTLITSLSHIYDDGGWRTVVGFGLGRDWVSHARIVPDLGAAGLVPPIAGLQIGIVQRFRRDENSLYRIPVHIPALSSGDIQKEIVFARLGTLDAGPKRGSFFQPEPGDEVIIGFFNDDPRQPVILGAMHSEKNAPPKDILKPDTSYQEKGFVVEKDMRLLFASPKTGAEVTLQSSKKTAIKLDETGAGTITMDVPGDVKIGAGKNYDVRTVKVAMKSRLATINSKVKIV